MGFDREQIRDDLRGLLEGEVFNDPLRLQLYATDASIYEIPPLGVVRPRSTEDVVKTVQYAAENLIPLHPRGAGSGLAGESLGPGLIIDFAHFMRRVQAVGSDTVRLQPGVVVANLNRLLANEGRTFGPDPATSNVSTMGSVASMDGSGSHWLRYGSARRHIVSMQVVLADGNVIEAARHPVPKATDPPSGRTGQLVIAMAELSARNREVIQANQPKSLVNRSGYHLDGIFENNHVNLAQLLVGSEGTLALTTEMTVRTEPLPRHVGVALLFFDRLDTAARAALEIPHLGASACDLLDRRLLNIARETDPLFDEILPAGAEAVLLIEAQGQQLPEVRDRLNQIVHRIRRRDQLAFDARIALEAAQVDLFWSLSQKVVPRLYRLRGSSRPLPFVESMAIPPETLPDFLVRMQNVLKRHQVTASLFAHAGHGQLHVRPFLDLGKPEDVAKMQPLAADLYHEVMEVHGTIGGEHGDGLSRTWFLREQYGPLYDVFREVKQIFDPKNLFNPGKVVATVPPHLTANLRQQPKPPGSLTSEAPAAPSITIDDFREDEDAVDDVYEDGGDTPVGMPQLVQLQLAWQPSDVVTTASACNGCGSCRSQLGDVRMCPIFRFAPREEATPRAKANLMRALMTGRIDPTEMASDEMKGIADLCVHCHQCRFECPAGVDIPKLMVEAKGQFVATHGLRAADTLVARFEDLLAWGNLLAPIANWALGNRVTRWMLERFVGVAQGRKLPRFAGRTFLHSAEGRKFTRPPRGNDRKVLYFVDVYANYFDVQLAEATVAVLEHNGVTVYIHPEQKRSGMELFAAGALEMARDVAWHNIRLLAEAVRQGYTIVATEPSATLCLTHEYPQLIDHDEARLVAANTQDACAYLRQMQERGELELDFRPVNATVGYHLPCHQRAMQHGSPAEELLRLIPALSVRRIEKGCSGMAGLFGMKQENYRASLRAGWGVIQAMREPQLMVGSTECSTCKVQMEQGTTKPTIHPLKLLALSYGVMPELSDLLSSRGDDLLVT